MHHQNAASQHQGLVDVVGDEHYSDAGLNADAQEFLLELAAGNLVHGAERLVHQKDFRGCGKGSGQPHPLLLAAGEFFWIAAAEAFVQPHNLQPP